MAYTAIDDPEAYFQVVLYTGNGSDDKAITFDGDTDMQPDFVWIKERDDTSAHNSYDSVRGVTKYLYVDEAGTETTTDRSLTAFDSDGFTVNDHVFINESGSTYVAWCWKESATAGFDIVAYTGNGSDRDISHSLSAVPSMLIAKNLESTHNWMVNHQPLNASLGDHSRFMTLNSNGAVAGANNVVFQDAAMTSSVFNVGTSAVANENTKGIIAYVFAPVQGFSKFGLYTGNGDIDGPFVYTGFRPAYVIAKESSSSGHWRIRDNKRSIFNPVGIVSHANANTGDTTEDNTDFLSNGFKLRTTGGENNGSGDTYIYAAFAEAPFVNSNGVPCNAR